MTFIKECGLILFYYGRGMAAIRGCRAMLNESCFQETVEAGEWVRYLGGEPVLHGYFNCAALAIGQYRFPSRPERFTAPPISRHYMSITFDGATEVERNLGDERNTARFSPGTSLIMSAGQVNSWRWDKPTEEIHLYLCPDFLRRMGETADLANTELVERFAFSDPDLQRLAGQLLEEIRSPGIASDLWVESVTNLLYMHVLRNYCTTSSSTRFPGIGLTSAQLRRVEEFVEAHMDREVTLAEMAEVTNVSRFHFAHMFKRSMGLPPHQWLIQKRVERAKQLLRNTRLSITEVAFEVGYQSQSHFGHVFRRSIGMSPRKWRAQIAS